MNNTRVSIEQLMKDCKPFDWYAYYVISLQIRTDEPTCRFAAAVTVDPLFKVYTLS